MRPRRRRAANKSKTAGQIRLKHGFGGWPAALTDLFCCANHVLGVNQAKSQVGVKKKVSDLIGQTRINRSWRTCVTEDLP